MANQLTHTDLDATTNARIFLPVRPGPSTSDGQPNRAGATSRRRALIAGCIAVVVIVAVAVAVNGSTETIEPEVQQRSAASIIQARSTLRLRSDP